MEDTHDQTASTSLAPEAIEAIEIYNRYFLEHIAPIKEAKLRGQYGTILIDVCGNLYGNWAAVHLAARFLNSTLKPRD